MKTELQNLANALKDLNPKAADKIEKLAGRYDKAPIPMPTKLQPAYKYIMYLKLMRGLDESAFHTLKRKYLNTSLDIQEECRKELDKMINEDSLSSKFSSAEIRRSFNKKLIDFA